MMRFATALLLAVGALLADAQTNAPSPRPCPANTPLPETPEWHGSPLAKAVLEEKPFLVEKLLSEGASPDEKDNSGDPPLILALIPKRRLSPIGIGSREQREASIEKENRAQVEIAAALINHNANVNAQSRHGITPMMQLLMSGYGEQANLKLARLMIAHKANLKLQDDYGNTALLYVGRIELAKLFLENGADPTLANCRHESALENAKKANNRELLQLFESYKLKR